MPDKKNVTTQIKKHKYSGSKTSKPLKSTKSTKPITNMDNTSDKTDISSISDIKRMFKIKSSLEYIEHVDREIEKKSTKNTCSASNTNIMPDKFIPTTSNKKINIIVEKPHVADYDESTDSDDCVLSDVDYSNNNNLMASYLEAKKFLVEHGIKISTITLDCKLHTLIDVDIFSKNVTLRENGIVSVKFGNRKDPATNRTIITTKKPKKQSTKNFFNQVTILMKPLNNPGRNYINIKVFKNGSLQMTGCKDMDDFNNVTNRLIKILKRGHNVKTKNGKVSNIKFIHSPDDIGIFNIKIRMINSNFKLDYCIDRKKLDRLLKKYHSKNTTDKEIGYVDYKYDPTGGHSCVNIKYHYDNVNKPPSVFVFRTGSIIITGAKTLNHIISAYHYILSILNRYYDEIKIVKLDSKKVQAELARFFKKSQMAERNV